MKSFKSVFKKIFFTPPFVTVIVAVPSFVLVAAVLASGEKSFVSYIAYGVSAYAMIVCITGFSRFLKSVKGKGGLKNIAPMRALRSNPWGAKLVDDKMFRSKISLAGGLLANLFYAALNVYSSFVSPSSWSAAMAVYYILLTAMRATLAKYMYKNSPGQDMRAEYVRERAVGIMLLIMNLALATMTVYMVYKNKGSSYSGVMIYAMAAYTFYITISAIINVCRIHKQNSAVMSAVRVISLTASLVSMMSLARAMMNEFGKNNTEFRQIMMGCMGAVTCVTVTVMAIFMIAKSTKRLRILKSGNNLERSAAV